MAMSEEPCSVPYRNILFGSSVLIMSRNKIITGLQSMAQDDDENYLPERNKSESVYRCLMFELR